MSLFALPNGRDLGGHVTGSGLVVREGLVLRGAAPMNDEQVAEVEGKGVRLVFDLRTAGEREFRPGITYGDATVIEADMLADEPEAGPASLGKIARTAMSGDTEPVSADELRATFVRSYRSFVNLGSARAVSHEVLAYAAQHNSKPMIIHCTAGKDRTGWLSALILLALDVPWNTVLSDYLASGPAVAELFAPYREKYASEGGDVAAMDVALGVFPEYLESARSAMLAGYGSLDAYLREGLDLPGDFRGRLAARMLTQRAELPSTP